MEKDAIKKIMEETQVACEAAEKLKDVKDLKSAQAFLDNKVIFTGLTPENEAIIRNALLKKMTGFKSDKGRDKRLALMENFLENETDKGSTPEQVEYIKLKLMEHYVDGNNKDLSKKMKLFAEVLEARKQPLLSPEEIAAAFKIKVDNYIGLNGIKLDVIEYATIGTYISDLPNDLRKRIAAGRKETNLGITFGGGKEFSWIVKLQD